VDVQVEKLRQTMIENLKNIKAAYSLAMNELTSQSNRAMREMSLMPGKEKQLLDITRRQKILEELYSLLLQKKLETSISAASTISGVKVIEPALASGIPVRPNSKGVYTLAFFLGLLIPGAVIFMIEFLNDKVRSRNDVQRITDAPILGEIGHSNEGQTLVVTKRSRKFIAEQFRIIRTNLQYVLPRVNKQVLMVTSTVSGEGKTFVSINLGAVMALLGKKTVIFEFDIRKPKIGSTLGLQSKKGITNFLIGNASFEELPTPVPGTENLFIIPCGPVPPNPAELLFSEKLAELIAKAREVYDVVVIDTAPVGLVSDANTLGKFADATLYIIRHNHTFKKQLRLLNDIYTDKRLPKVSIVVNDIEKGPGYGYQYGYSYSNNSYGYGYGGGYFEEEEVKEDFFKRWKRRLAFWK
jgi:capsular exopolysaccharide synthesis family protein